MVALVAAGVAIVGVGIAVVGVLAGTAGMTVTSGPPNPVATPGEACNGRRAACSNDGKAQLLCGANDRMVVGQTCKGPNACRATRSGKSVTCDTTLADLKDPCNITDDACSTDLQGRAPLPGRPLRRHRDLQGPGWLHAHAGEDGVGLHPVLRRPRRGCR